MVKIKAASRHKKEKVPLRPLEGHGREINETMLDSFKLSELVKRLFQYTTPPTEIKLSPDDLHVLLYLVGSRYRLMNRPLLELSGPVTICGDIHGKYSDFLRIFAACGAPSKNKYLFLGNYVDIGSHSLEVITLLFALQLAMPKNVYLLRGSHEQRSINKECGFYAELRRRYRCYGPTVHEDLFEHFNEVFTWMPVAAVVSKRILCVHGGISPKLDSLDDIRAIPMPQNKFPGDRLAFDLMWSSPDVDAMGFETKKKTPVVKQSEMKSTMYDKIRARYLTESQKMIDNVNPTIFGPKEIDKVCQKLDIDLIICSGRVVEFGYAFFAGRRLITVCSTARLVDCNYAAMVLVTKSLEVGFVQLKPEDFERQRDEEDGFNEQNAHVSKPRGASTDKEPVCKRSTKEKHEKEKSKMK